MVTDIRIKDSMHVETVKRLSQADEKDLFDWAEQVFPAEGNRYTWASPSWHIVARVKDLAVAHIGYGRFPMEASESRMEIVGICGVVVRPEYQGRGIAKRLFATLHQQAEAHNLASSLFCPQRLAGFYQRFGYRAFEGELCFLQGQHFVSVTDICFMLRNFEPAVSAIRILSHPW